jgi:hypothetical protein
MEIISSISSFFSHGLIGKLKVVLDMREALLQLSDVDLFFKY